MSKIKKTIEASGNDRRYDRPPQRRTYNSPSNYINPQFKGTDNKINGKPRKGGRKPDEWSQVSSQVAELLPQIKPFLEKMAVAGNRLADAEERKAAALEKIAEQFSTMEALAPQIDARQQKPSVQIDDSPPRTTSKDERERVMDIINGMREKGATYHKIANHLENENIPTFSGKGKWHAQTIHRLCRDQG